LGAKEKAKTYKLFKERVCSKLSGIFENYVIRSQIKNCGIVTKGNNVQYNKMFTVEICISPFYGTYQKVTDSNSVGGKKF
jgi:hypothetical protein